MAHAYLISTNNIDKCLEVLINVIKNIFCVQEYSINCNKCSLCHLIDIRNLPSLKIIEPDGSFIKKNQILELEEAFSKLSQYTKENIYIIKNCEKMNKESANTMLKFLEEPEGNVIGFFITNDINNVLPTIISRCQHIQTNFDLSYNEKFNISKEKYDELFKIALQYLNKIEVNKKESVLYNKEYLSNLEKKDIITILQIILHIYENKLKGSKEIEYLNNYSLKNIKKKIDLLIELLGEIAYNVNTDLLLDRFIIEMEVINNETL